MQDLIEQLKQEFANRDLKLHRITYIWVKNLPNPISWVFVSNIWKIKQTTYNKQEIIEKLKWMIQEVEKFDDCELELPDNYLLETDGWSWFWKFWQMMWWRCIIDALTLVELKKKDLDNNK